MKLVHWWWPTTMVRHRVIHGWWKSQIDTPWADTDVVEQAFKDKLPIRAIFQDILRNYIDLIGAGLPRNEDF